MQQSPTRLRLAFCGGGGGGGGFGLDSRLAILVTAGRLSFLLVLLVLLSLSRCPCCTFYETLSADQQAQTRSPDRKETSRGRRTDRWLQPHWQVPPPPLSRSERARSPPLSVHQRLPLLQEVPLASLGLPPFVLELQSFVRGPQPWALERLLFLAGSPFYQSARLLWGRWREQRLAQE